MMNDECEMMNDEFGSSKESVGKRGMSFSLFNQDTDLKKTPLTLPSPPGEEILSPIAFWSYPALT